MVIQMSNSKWIYTSFYTQSNSSQQIYYHTNIKTSHASSRSHTPLRSHTHTPKTFFVGQNRADGSYYLHEFSFLSIFLGVQFGDLVRSICRSPPTGCPPPTGTHATAPFRRQTAQRCAVFWPDVTTCKREKNPFTCCVRDVLSPTKTGCIQHIYKNTVI